jgi:branched-chain amino acid transport system substrate-binding protein
MTTNVASRAVTFLRETAFGPFAPRLAASAALLCLVLAQGCGGERTSIRLGLAGPFGEPRGTSMQLAAQLAVQEINAAGGVRGRPLELAVEDDQADAEHAVEIAHRLYDDHSIVAVIGHLTSGTTMAAAPVYNGGEHPVTEISPSASNPLLSNAGPYSFRVCPTDLVHGARLAAFATVRLGARRAAILYINDSYGRGVRTVFNEEFGKRGGRIVTDDPYLDDLPGFEPYLERLRRRGGADVLLIAGTRPGAERILTTLDSLRMRPAVMGGDGITGVEAAGRLADGVYISEAYLPDRPGAKNAAFVQAYRAAYGNREPDHRGAGAYDIVYLLARAIREVGPDRTRIRDYLAGVGSRTPPFEGVTGRIVFDDRGDVPDKEVVIGVVRGGRLVTVEGE